MIIISLYFFTLYYLCNMAQEPNFIPFVILACDVNEIKSYDRFNKTIKNEYHLIFNNNLIKSL